MFCELSVELYVHVQHLMHGGHLKSSVTHEFACLVEGAGILISRGHGYEYGMLR